jgi:single-stranded DNA-binding protein
VANEMQMLDSRNMSQDGGGYAPSPSPAPMAQATSNDNYAAPTPTSQPADFPEDDIPF